MVQIRESSYGGERKKMAYNKANVGIAAIIFGVVIFVVVTGDVIFRVLGILLAIVLVNYGLALMGKPPLFILAQDFFDQVKR